MMFLFDDLVNKDKKMGVHLSGDEEARKKDEIIFSRKENLARILSNILYQSGNAKKEHGSNVLYISFGILKWTDENNKKVETQLFFVPVEITKKLYDNFIIEAKEGDIFFNPVLKEKLEQFGIKYDFNFDGNLNVSEAMKTFKLTIKEAKWTVNNNVYLGMLSFTNNTIYNDIKNNHGTIKSNDLTRALAGDLDVIKKLNNKMPEQVDYSINTVMDADSSQIKAIYAARKGASFILNGPPGTGKSQTISNIIADSLSSGKSVLFVSEKNAAIEVVKKRLEDIGLEDFILNFHGSRSKTEIIKSLYKSIEDDKKVQDSNLPVDRYTEILNSYVEALHRPRGKIMRSVYDACAGELENYTGFNFNISGSMLEKSQEELDEIEFQLSELNDYHDIISRYMDFPQTFKIEKYRESPELFYKNINILLNSIEKLTDLSVDINSLINRNPKSIKELEGYYNIISLINPDLCLKAELLDRDFIDKSYRLIENREKLIKEYDYKKSIFCKKYSEEFLNTDLKSLEKSLQEYSSSIKRLSSAYKEMVKNIQKYQKDDARKKYDEILEDLNYGIGTRHLLEQLNEIDGEIAENGINVSTIEDRVRYARKILNAIPENTDINSIIHLFDCSVDGTKLEAIKNVYTSIRSAVNYLEEVIPESVDFMNISLKSLEDYIKVLDTLDIERYVKLIELMSSLKSSGIDILSMMGNSLPQDYIIRTFKSSFNKEFVNYWIEHDDILGSFRAPSHERIIGMFLEFDKKKMEINRHKMLYTIYSSREKALAENPEVSMLIKTENAKKRMQKPIKELFRELGSVLKVIKPCIMMSPSNVSSYLYNDFKFDILIFDEASQLTPPEAVGALIRSGQVIVSGDTEQLPPTVFFENINMARYDDNYVILDNILDQFDALGLNKIQLQWHYRSVDDKLIAFSNKYFYDNRLETFPSAYKSSPDSGIYFIRVEGIYSRGKSRTNKTEANEVVKLIKDELNNTTSIGVVTLSESQRSEIEDILFSFARHDPVLSEIINKDELFIKNLENVQGDERDVIILSTGYGRDSEGKMTMNFGPINTSGGEKRLNVAITRARKKVIIVSSMDPEDIRLPQNSGRGPELLKKYMIFAKNGGNDIELKQFAGNDGIILDLEKRLKNEGLIVDRDIGYSRNNIPLAVVDPGDENHYILGIETDGKIYNSMKTASERERIRKSILNDRKWNLFRVWSIDYVKNPERYVHNIVNTVNRLSTKIEK